MTAIGRGKIPINQIIIGERLRSDTGDIDVLALNISAHGWVEPVVVHQIEEHKYELISGYRRILACKRLGYTEIEYVEFERLNPDDKVLLELELNVRRKSLTYLEEAHACKKLIDMKRVSNAGRVSHGVRPVRNKEIALQLGISEPALSQNLAIATALEEHPEMASIKTKKEFLQRIARKEYTVVTATKTALSESYILGDLIETTKNLPQKSVDFAILTEPSEDLVTALAPKIKLGGSFVIFCDFVDVSKWKPVLDKLSLYISPCPYMWVIKGEDSYATYIWVGKGREQPLRPMPLHLTQARSKTALSKIAKPYALASMLYRTNTEVANFIYIPQCEDLDSIRCAIDMDRNVRGVTMDKILRDRLLMTQHLGQTKGDDE